MDIVEHAERDSRITAEPRSFDLFDFLLVLSEFRKTIALSIAVSMVIGIIFCIFLKPTFTGAAIILPPQQGQSLASMMGQLSALVSLAGIGGSSGSSLKTPTDMYIGILESRTIADSLILKFHLQQLYKTHKMEDTAAT